ncbi:hypothetical protein [Mycolicibacterium pyrenivorans]|nr:hypothetical protein [Mycolicibacterium pyrenivorans]
MSNSEGFAVDTPVWVNTSTGDEVRGVIIEDFGPTAGHACPGR